MLRTSYQLTLLLLVFCATNAFAQFPCNTGNTVSAAGQGSTINLCQLGDPPIISFNNSVEALPHGFIVTDENNVIVSIGLNSVIDFSTLPGNNFRVYGFNFIGSITATVGQTLGNTSIANACYSVSSNFISVSASGGLDGGTLDGGPFSFCVGDGQADMITPGAITLSGNMGGNNAAWVVTDADGNILGLPPTPSAVNFDGAGGGECLIWNLSYDDGLEGLEVGANVSGLQGCYGLSNPISVFRSQPDGGNIYTDNNASINRVVIANRASSSISVIDSDQNTVLSTHAMPDDGEPMYAVYNSSNRTVLVGDYNGKVVAFDAVTFDATGQADAGAGVFHMWISPDNQQLWVNNELDRNISVINPNTLQTIATVDLPTDLYDAGYKPHDVIVMPDNSAAFVTLIGSNGEDYVLKYDAATFEETARATVGADPHVSLTSANDKLYVASQVSSEVKVLNRSDLSEVTTVNIPNAHGLGMNTDGTYLYVGNISEGGANATYTLDLSNNTLVGAPVDAPFSVPHNYAVSNNNDQLFLTHSGPNDQVSVYDLSPTPSLVTTITVENNPFGLVAYSVITTTELEICAGDGQSDAFDVTLENASGANSQWVITDPDLNILALPPGPPFDLEGAGAGTCLVWHLSYDDGLTGLEVGLNAADFDGCYNLSNPITVVRYQPEGGTLDGGPFTFCVGDGVADMIAAGDITLSGNSGTNSAWVVTDANGNILGLPPTPADVNFDGAGPGECLVWHLSYEDGLTGAEVGANAADLQGCYSLSNPISVFRNQPEGGTLDGGPFTFCVGDGVDDMIAAGDITLSGNSGSNSAWVVTDVNGNILGLPPTPGDVNFDGAGPGECFIWHLSYEDGLTGAEVGANAADLQGCYSLSNPISVFRNQPEGGTLDGGPFTFCVGDGVDDMIAAGDITLTGNSGTNSAWVVTDVNGNILGLPPTPGDVNFDGAGPGECLVWHLSYEDGLTGAEVGANAADLQGCYSLSNPISVFRNQPDGGTLDGGPFTFCVGDGVDDMIAAGDITLSGNSGTNSAWVVTDVNGNILGLPPTPADVNFDGAGPGECLIWHLSYEDGLTGAEVGANAADLQGCYSLSNPISVFRNQPEGGTLDGGPFTFCVGDGVDDMIAAGDITLTGNSGTNSAWVVTDVNGNILGLPPTPSDVNFDGAGPGECLVWHLSYEDGLTGAEVGANAADLQGCYSLSNPISVFRNQPEGGTLDGGPFTFCVGDGVDDMIAAGDITLTGNSGTNSAWVVTDVNGNILGLPPTPGDVNFDGAGPGECLVWHLSYEDGLTGAEVGANAADLQGCYSLSNPISVFRNQPEGGTLDGGPFTFCVSDGVDDMITAGDITLTGNSGTNTAWVVTDVNGNILGLPPTPADVNFDGAGPGECLVWHLSYEDGLTGAEVGANAADLQGCYSLSNPISVFRIEVNGGMVMTEDGETEITVTVGDGIDDIIHFDSIDVVGDQFTYVVTDDNNVIIAVPGGDQVNFEGAGIGVCRVWGLAYTGNITAMPGDTASLVDLSDGCFDLSDNFITVIREGNLIEPEFEVLTDKAIADVVITPWPNPTSRALNIRIKQGAGVRNASINIISFSGQVVHRIELDDDAALQQLEVDVTNFPGGIYNILYQSEKVQRSERFIKQ